MKIIHLCGSTHYPSACFDDPVLGDERRRHFVLVRFSLPNNHLPLHRPFATFIPLAPHFQPTPSQTVASSSSRVGGGNATNECLNGEWIQLVVGEKTKRRWTMLGWVPGANEEKKGMEEGKGRVQLCIGAKANAQTAMRRWNCGRAHHCICVVVGLGDSLVVVVGLLLIKSSSIGNIGCWWTTNPSTIL